MTLDFVNENTFENNTADLKSDFGISSSVIAPEGTNQMSFQNGVEIASDYYHPIDTPTPGGIIRDQAGKVIWSPKS